MSKFTGFFDLKTPADLLKKLASDLERMREIKLDTYAAFDFFVTAEHMLDWIYPKDVSGERSAMRNANVLLQVCSHLASGAKHFEATHRTHTSVVDTEHHSGEFTREFSREFDVSRLIIRLDGAAATQFGDCLRSF